MTTESQQKFLDSSSAPHLFTLISLAGVSALAMNVFLPVLPQMADHFATTPAIMGLSVGVFLASSAVIQIVTGPVSDMIGRRPVILWSLVIFMLATVACIFAPNAATFLVFRAIQASAAVGMTTARAIVRDTNEGPRAASLIAYVTMGMAVVPMLAPAAGGFLGRYFGWESTFILLLVVGLVIFAMVWWDLGETHPASGATLGEQFRQYPELLKSVRFWCYCLASALGSGAFFAYLGGAPFVGTEVFGLEPQELGVYFGAPALGYIVGNFLSGRYSQRIGINRMILAGLCLTTTAAGISLIISLGGNGSVASFFGAMTFLAIGNGMTIPNATAGMLSVRPHLSGTASGLGSAMMIGGGAVLSALAGFELEGGHSEVPLVLIMTVSAAAGLPFIAYVMWRDFRLKRIAFRTRRLRR